MTENEQDPIAMLRAEFAQELQSMKDAYKAEKEDSEKRIAELAATNESLRRELVRKTVFEPEPEPEPVKTEEELLQEQISNEAKKALDYIKRGILQ